MPDGLAELLFDVVAVQVVFGGVCGDRGLDLGGRLEPERALFLPFSVVQMLQQAALLIGRALQFQQVIG